MNNLFTTRRLMAIAIASFLVAAPALSKDNDHEEHGNSGHGRKHEGKQDKRAAKQLEKQQKHAAQREDVRVGAYFNDQHRAYARQYYREHYGDGRRCPPGLAKKNNGCLPPGQARKWAVGQPVPAGVALYPVPQPVVLQLPPPPYGYRYARIGNDIVLVQQQNNLIVDIILGVLG